MSSSPEGAAAANVSGHNQNQSGAGNNDQKNVSAKGKPDTLNSEFVYYSSLLKVLCGGMSNIQSKKKIMPWVKKLFRPEYHSIQIREKRNKYLLYLSITIMNDEAFGIFVIPPPDGVLADLSTIAKPDFPPAEWELDQTWIETVNNLPADFQKLSCSVHNSKGECDKDHELDTILDLEFQFLLYILRPYATLLPNTYDRTRIATWMQTLCSITENACSSMRGIRNDYIMVLLSYAQNLTMTGVFAGYPPITKLPPLAEAAKAAAEARPITDPTGPAVTEFLSRQPQPEEGAFCYIALTGDLIGLTLPDNGDE